MRQIAGITALSCATRRTKEDITQIIYEPWHFRYVGLEPALYMRDNNLSLEEFTAEWHDAVTAFDGTEFTSISVEDMENE